MSTVFSPKHEKLNLLLPFLFMPFVLWEYWTAKNFSIVEKATAIYLSKIVFLNHIHVYFTFALLLFFPEVRRWTTKGFAKSSSAFWLKVALIYCFFLGLSVVMTKPGNLTPWLFKTISYLLVLYSIYHALWQSYGISRMYPTSKAVEVYEKRLAHFIFAIVALQIGLRIIPNFKGSAYFHSLTLISILAFARLLYLIHQDNKTTKTNKIYFVARYIMIILTPSFFSAAVTGSALHGMEYLFVFLTMSKNTQATISTKRIIWSFLAICSVIGIVAAAFKQDSAVAYGIFKLKDEDVSMFWIALANLTGALSLVHFYMDGKLFEFKKSEAREHILPLLAGPKKIIAKTTTPELVSLQYCSESHSNKGKLGELYPPKSLPQQSPFLE